MQGKAIVKFVDVWKNKDAAADFPVQVIPTQFYFDKKGNPFDGAEEGDCRQNRTVKNN